MLSRKQTSTPVKENQKQLNNTDGYNKLTCSLCKKYLSVPPIFISTDGKLNKCGRCKESPTHGRIWTRNIEYEKLAKYMLFPCSESKNCTEIVFWDEITTHENTCPFRDIICPLENCSELYEVRDALSHFSNKHKVYSGHAIIHSFLCKTGNSDIILINLNNICFLAFLKMDGEFLRFNVFKLACDDIKHKFAVTFISEYNRAILRNSIEPYPVKHRTINNNLLTNILKDVKKDILLGLPGAINHTPFPIKIKLRILNEEKNKGLQLGHCIFAYKDIILQKMVCPTCYEPLSSIVYMCRTGHSFCFKCKQRSGCYCHICIHEINNNRNCALEALYQKCIKMYQLSSAN